MEGVNDWVTYPRISLYKKTRQDIGVFLCFYLFCWGFFPEPPFLCYAVFAAVECFSLMSHQCIVLQVYCTNFWVSLSLWVVATWCEIHWDGNQYIRLKVCCCFVMVDNLIAKKKEACVKLYKSWGFWFVVMLKMGSSFRSAWNVLLLASFYQILLF